MPINHRFGPSGKPTDTDLPTCELISSEGKEEGWQNVLARLPDLVRSTGSTRRELLALHEIASYGSRFMPPSPEMEEVFLEHLALNDNPDAETIMREVRFRLDYLGLSGLLTPRSRKAAKLKVAKQFFRPHLRVDLRSEIRSVGTRQYADGRKEQVFDSHTLPIWTPEGNRFFLGLTYGLDELYGELCDRYDGMRSRATTIKQQIMAELYLQMIGTRLLHPFWDGNGRTFAAHLIVTLNRLGLPIDSIPKENDIYPQGDDGFLLAYVNEKFLFEIIKPNFVLTEEEVGEMDKNPLRRNDHMKRLYAAIRNVIEKGIFDSEFRPFGLNAYHQLRVWLHIKGFLPYSENRPTAENVQRHTAERAALLKRKIADGTISPRDLDWSEFNI